MISVLSALQNIYLTDKMLSQPTAQNHHQSRWKQLLSTELESGYSARRLYEYLSDRQIDSIMSQARTKGFTDQIIHCEDISFDWHSKLIGRMINYPGIHNVLKLINPIFAKLAQQTDIWRTVISSWMKLILAPPICLQHWIPKSQWHFRDIKYQCTRLITRRRHVYQEIQKTNLAQLS